MNQRMCEGVSDKKNECDGDANECGGQRKGKELLYGGKRTNTGMLYKSKRFGFEGEIDGIIIPSIHQLISKSQYGFIAGSSSSMRSLGVSLLHWCTQGCVV